MVLPPLETDRLRIRPFVLDDLGPLYALLDVEPGAAAPGLLQPAEPAALDARRHWLEWSILGYQQFAALHQPPYGDRAIVLRSSGELAGACGLVPCLDRFGQIPGLAPHVPPGRTATELGLYYALAPSFRGKGYATEAARALIGYAFGALGLWRVIATTNYDNAASIAVMRRLGMRIARNPEPEPPWLQVVGVLEA